MALIRKIAPFLTGHLVHASGLFYQDAVVPFSTLEVRRSSERCGAGQVDGSHHRTLTRCNKRILDLWLVDARRTVLTCFVKMSCYVPLGCQSINELPRLFQRNA